MASQEELLRRQIEALQAQLAQVTAVPGDALPGLTPSMVKWREAVDDAEKSLVLQVLRTMVNSDPECALKANPIAYELREGRELILYGRPQAGKTRETLILAWIAHFVYSVTSIIFTKHDGGDDSKAGFRGAMDDLNKEIRAAVEALRPGAPKTLVERFRIFAVEEDRNMTEAHFAKCTVLLRTFGKNNLELVLAGKETKKLSLRADLRVISGLHDNWAAEYPERAARAGYTPPGSGGKHRVLCVIDEGDKAVQSPGLKTGSAEQLTWAAAGSASSSSLWSATAAGGMDDGASVLRSVSQDSRADNAGAGSSSGAGAGAGGGRAATPPLLQAASQEDNVGPLSGPGMGCSEEYGAHGDGGDDDGDGDAESVYSLPEEHGPALSLVDEEDSRFFESLEGGGGAGARGRGGNAAAGGRNNEGDSGDEGHDPSDASAREEKRRRDIAAFLRLYGGVLNACMHVAYVTATPAGLILAASGTGDRVFSYVDLPLRRNGGWPYYGYGDEVDEERRIRHVEVEEGEPARAGKGAAVVSVEERHPGLMTMIFHMYTEPEAPSQAQAQADVRPQRSGGDGAGMPPPPPKVGKGASSASSIPFTGASAFSARSGASTSSSCSSIPPAPPTPPQQRVALVHAEKSIPEQTALREHLIRLVDVTLPSIQAAGSGAGSAAASGEGAGASSASSSSSSSAGPALRPLLVLTHNSGVTTSLNGQRSVSGEGGGGRAAPAGCCLVASRGFPLRILEELHSGIEWARAEKAARRQPQRQSGRSGLASPLPSARASAGRRAGASTPAPPGSSGGCPRPASPAVGAPPAPAPPAPPRPPQWVINALNPNKKLGVVARVDLTARAVHFAARGTTIAKAMDLCSMLLAQNPVHTPLVIISGQMGDRGTTFKSTDRSLHLTDQFISLRVGAANRYAIQMASRLCGRYADRPTLRLWCTKRDYARLLGSIRAERILVDVARSAGPDENVLDAFRRHAFPVEIFHDPAIMAASSGLLTQYRDMCAYALADLTIVHPPHYEGYYVFELTLALEKYYRSVHGGSRSGGGETGGSVHRSHSNASSVAAPPLAAVHASLSSRASVAAMPAAAAEAAGASASPSANGDDDGDCVMDERSSRGAGSAVARELTRVAVPAWAPADSEPHGAAAASSSSSSSSQSAAVQALTQRPSLHYGASKLSPAVSRARLQCGRPALVAQYTPAILADVASGVLPLRQCGITHRNVATELVVIPLGELPDAGGLRDEMTLLAQQQPATAAGGEAASKGAGAASSAAAGTPGKAPIHKGKRVGGGGGLPEPLRKKIVQYLRAKYPPSEDAHLTPSNVGPRSLQAHLREDFSPERMLFQWCAASRCLLVIRPLLSAEEVAALPQPRVLIHHRFGPESAEKRVVVLASYRDGPPPPAPPPPQRARPRAQAQASSRKRKRALDDDGDAEVREAGDGNGDVEAQAMAPPSTAGDDDATAGGTRTISAFRVQTKRARKTRQPAAAAPAPSSSSSSSVAASSSAPVAASAAPASASAPASAAPEHPPAPSALTASGGTGATPGGTTPSSHCAAPGGAASETLAAAASASVTAAAAVGPGSESDAATQPLTDTQEAAAASPLEEDVAMAAAPADATGEAAAAAPEQEDGGYESPYPWPSEDEEDGDVENGESDGSDEEVGAVAEARAPRAQRDSGEQAAASQAPRDSDGRGSADPYSKGRYEVEDEGYGCYDDPYAYVDEMLAAQLQQSEYDDGDLDAGVWAVPADHGQHPSGGGGELWYPDVSMQGDGLTPDQHRARVVARDAEAGARSIEEGKKAAASGSSSSIAPRPSSGP